ncbi:hypothetical protein Gotri_020425, partial [Gossypium trilobum]|nr:hypothetical protein [Gossypium trilobum]
VIKIFTIKTDLRLVFQKLGSLISTYSDKYQ